MLSKFLICFEKWLKITAGLLIINLWLAIPLMSQQLILDRPVRAGDLTLFPDLQNELSYYYVLNQAALATDENGKPQFSFLRYVENKQSAGSESFTEAEGGGIVHAVVSLAVTEEQLNDAKRALQRIKPDATIKGSAIYKSGKFGLVSSFQQENGDLTTQVLGLGTAPILGGNKAAISLQLTKKGATLLWESFKTPTPDITFSFEMMLTGFRSPLEARLEADFDQINKHKTFDVGIASPVFNAEITAAFDDLVKNGAIKFTGVEADEHMSELINMAFRKLTDMMMEPLSQSVNDMTALNQKQSMLDRASTSLQRARDDTKEKNRHIRDDNDQARDDAKDLAEVRAAQSADGTGTASYQRKNEETLPTFSIAAGYRMRETKVKGKFTVSLNKYLADEIPVRFDENIGTINCKKCFHQVNLSDPLFQQREIFAFIDGYNAADFGKYINFVSVRIEKKHQSGEVSYDEVRIDRKSFNENENNFKMLYGWKGDKDRNQWMDYKYETLWSFFGGHEIAQPFKTNSFNSINLHPPYQKQSIELFADPAVLQQAGVRAIIVKLYFKVGEKESTKQVTLSSANQFTADKIIFIFPPDKTAFDYEISWRLKEGQTKKTERKTAHELILFVDELPE